jgi:hypothetical protein
MIVSGITLAEAQKQDPKNRIIAMLPFNIY